jgi:hypothetical protein
MSQKNFLHLVSEIMALASDFDPDDISEAEQYVRNSFAGKDAQRILAVLDAIKGISSDRARAATRAVASVPYTQVPLEHNFVGDVDKELQAMLRDEQFLPTKRELTAFLTGIVGLGAMPKSFSKASRETVASWALRELRKRTASQRKSAYDRVRQAYLNQRESSLEGWSNILMQKR